MRRVLLLGALLVLASGSLMGQATQDVLGMHNLGPGLSPVQGAASLGCVYCHAPHSGVGGNTPLWNQKLSKQTYTPYTSTTEQNTGTQPTLGESSSLCLSCHDGTVAVGDTAAYGKITMAGSMYQADVFGTNLQGSHPFSLLLPMKDSIDLAASLVSAHKTADPTGKVQLVKNNVECNSCHNPHVQGMDPVSPNFLVINSASGQLCFACHDPNRVITGQVNPLNNWPTGIHAIASNTVAANAGLGSYNTIAQNACISCHQPHNAPGSARLLRAPNPPLANVDTVSQSCATCHSTGMNISPAAPNVFAEYAKNGIGGGALMGTAHPWPAGTNLHDANEPALLNVTRHASCADCHNSHSAKQVATFPDAPPIRISQAGIAGISEIDGITVLNPAVNQYQNCLRCHGTSSGKGTVGNFGYLPIRVVSAADPLNVIPQFSASSTSRHPVFTDALKANQPSLLINMLQEDGVSQGRAIGSRIFCTDCHNSDDNREFGGSAPGGPHGSKYWHLLERRYEMSQSPGPGQLITNPSPSPNLSAGGLNPGPYALCAKCHNLAATAGGVLSDATFQPNKIGLGGHYTHVWTYGVSCSVCHTAHGMGATSANITGERLVNFDTNVVAPYQTNPIAYNRAANTCTLTCHGKNHLPNGSVN